MAGWGIITLGIGPPLRTELGPLVTAGIVTGPQRAIWLDQPAAGGDWSDQDAAGGTWTDQAQAGGTWTDV